MLAYLKRITEGFFSLALGIRIALGALLGALGSSSFLGFITEYATYNYALAYGVRVPTEGVPYLSFFITLVSLGLMLTALACFVGLFFLLRFFIRIAIIHISKDKTPPELSSLPLHKYLLLAAPGAVAATQPMVSIMAVSPDFYKSLSQYVTVGVPLTVAILVLIFVRKPEWIKCFITIFFICSVMIGTLSMFSPTTYGNFLRLIRYGGNVEVQLSRNCSDSSQCISSVNGQLFLRTKDYFILFDKSKYRVSEIPAVEVSSYSYPSEARWNNL